MTRAKLREIQRGPDHFPALDAYSGRDEHETVRVPVVHVILDVERREGNAVHQTAGCDPRVVGWPGLAITSRCGSQLAPPKSDVFVAEHHELTAPERFELGPL